MSLLPEWAPNIHPMLVHFPLAILFFAALMDFLTFFLDKKWWDEKKTAVTYMIGAVAAIIVYFTGGMAADSIDIPKSAYEAVGSHAGWAEWTVWYFGVYAVARLIFSAMDKFENSKVHFTFFVLSLVGLFFLYETGEHGANLVFNHGLGVNAEVFQKMEPKSDELPEGFVQDTTGGWSWTMNADAPEVFANQFAVLSSDTSGNVQAVSRDSMTFLEVSGGKRFFRSSADYSNFQFDVIVSANSLRDSILILHHIQNVSNYDFMKLGPDSSVSLGRTRKGEVEIIEQDTANWQQAHHIRLVNSGDHQRGYLDDELILHGHTEAAPEGGVGLKYSGNAPLLIRKMMLSPLSGEEAQHEEDEHHDE